MSDFFKSSKFVIQFFENVRMNDFCAKLNVFNLAITEVVFSGVHISIWPIALFVGLLRPHTLIFLTDLSKGSTLCRPAFRNVRTNDF